MPTPSSNPSPTSYTTSSLTDSVAIACQSLQKVGKFTPRPPLPSLLRYLSTELLRVPGPTSSITVRVGISMKPPVRRSARHRLSKPFEYDIPTLHNNE